MPTHAASRVFDLIIRACGLVACAGLGLLSVLVVASILLRNLGIAKWPWLNEVTEYLLTISTFLGAPWLLRSNGHVSVDVVLKLVPRAVTRVLLRAVNVAGAAICGLLLYEALRVITDTYAVGSLVFKNLIFPEWYMQVPMVICFALCFAEFLARLIGQRIAS